MGPKRDSSLTIRLAEHEKKTLSYFASQWQMNENEVVRACIAVAFPMLRDVPYLRRVQLEDNIAMQVAQ